MSQVESAFRQLVNQAKSRVEEIDASTLMQWQTEQREFLLFDVREESEWAAGHLPQANYLGKGIIERDIESRCPDRAATIVLYCGGGSRSALAADNLMKMGYQQVFSFLENVGGSFKSPQLITSRSN